MLFARIVAAVKDLSSRFKFSQLCKLSITDDIFQPTQSNTDFYLRIFLHVFIIRRFYTILKCRTRQ